MAAKTKVKEVLDTVKKQKESTTKKDQPKVATVKLSDKQKSLMNVMAKMSKDIGIKIDTVENQREELTITFLPTPSNEINIMLNGGLAKGKISIWKGPSGCGKTSLMLEIIAFNQKRDPNFTAIWFETSEASFDYKYAAMLGVDTTRLVYLSQDDLGAEKGLEAIRSFAGSGFVDFIVVNSLAGLTPSKEVSNSMEDETMALVARMMSKFFRVTGGVANKYKCHIAIINQLREKVGVMFGSPIVAPGGRAAEFHCTQHVDLGARKLEKSDPISKDDGMKIHCLVKKNRCSYGNPYKECTYYVEYEKGINNTIEIPIVLIREELVQTSGSWIYYPNKENPLTVNGTLLKFQSKKELCNVMSENEKVKIFFEDLINKNKTKGMSLSEEQIEEIKKEEENLKTELENAGVNTVELEEDTDKKE